MGQVRSCSHHAFDQLPHFGVDLLKHQLRQVVSQQSVALDQKNQIRCVVVRDCFVGSLLQRCQSLLRLAILLLAILTDQFGSLVCAPVSFPGNCLHCGLKQVHALRLADVLRTQDAIGQGVHADFVQRQHSLFK